MQYNFLQYQMAHCPLSYQKVLYWGHAHSLPDLLLSYLFRGYCFPSNENYNQMVCLLVELHRYTHHHSRIRIYYSR